QLGGATDAGEGGLELVGEGLGVALDVLFALEGGAHLVEGELQVADFLAGEAGGEFVRTAVADVAHVGRQAGERGGQPDGEADADGDDEQAAEHAAGEHASAGGGDEVVDVVGGLADGEHADDAAVVADGRGDVDAQGVFIAGGLAGGA